MTSKNPNITPDMASSSRHFSETDPLLQTCECQTQNTRYNANRKICGFQVEGPDSVHSCVVAFGAFLVSFIVAGIVRVYGILYPHMMRDFHINRQTAETPFSLQLVVRFLFGPFVGMLGYKYGVVMVTFFGGLISALSVGFCFFPHNFKWIIISWGCFSGIGCALSTSLLQMTVAQHFVVNRGMAVGMSLAGCCLGSMVLPPLIEILFEQYSLRIVFLFMAGFIAIVMLISVVFKEPFWLNIQDRVTEKPESMGTPRLSFSLDSSSQMMEGKDFNIRNMPNIKFLRKHKELVIKLLRRATIFESKTLEKDKLSLETSIWIGMEDVLKCVGEIMSKSDSLKTFTESDPISDKYPKQSVVSCSVPNRSTLKLGESTFIDIDEISNTHNRYTILMQLKEISCMSPSDIISACPKESKKDILQISVELKNLYNVATQLEKQQNGSFLHNSSVQNVQISKKDSSSRNSKCYYLNEMMKFLWKHLKPVICLYRKPIFLLISVSRATHFIAFVPVVPIIVDFMMEKGLPELDGQYGVMALSLGDFAGRMLTGWITDKGYLSLPHYMIFSMTAQCVSTATLPLIHNRMSMLLAFSIFGLLQGSIFIRHPVLISKYIDEQEQPFAMGCLSFFSGIIAIFLPYVGHYKDVFGTYDFIFYISGSAGAVVGLFWFCVPDCGVNDTTREPEEST